MSTNSLQWQQEQRLLETLASLSYRTGELDSFLKRVTLSINQLVCMDWVVITLCENHTEHLLASNLDIEYQVSSLHDTVTGYVVATGHHLLVQNATVNHPYGALPDGYQAYLGVPLTTPVGKVIGTICCFHRQANVFSPEDVTLVKIFAERVATAIDNYELYQEQRRLNNALETRLSEHITLEKELRVSQKQALEDRANEINRSRLKTRLAEVGELAAMIVHEVRNPLTTILMGLQSSQNHILPKSLQQRLAIAFAEAERLERLLKEILLYAKPNNLNFSRLEVNTFMADLYQSSQELQSTADQKIVFLPAPFPIMISGSIDKLKQVITNLIANACEASATNDEITWKIIPQQHQKSVHIQVHNWGTPIMANILDQITSPFFTTKQSGNGLGLAIVKHIVEDHNGQLTIKSDLHAGTTVTVEIPTVSI